MPAKGCLTVEYPLRIDYHASSLVRDIYEISVGQSKAESFYKSLVIPGCLLGKSKLAGGEFGTRTAAGDSLGRKQPRAPHLLRAPERLQCREAEGPGG